MMTPDASSSAEVVTPMNGRDDTANIISNAETPSFIVNDFMIDLLPIDGNWMNIPNKIILGYKVHTQVYKMVNITDEN